jgi:integral membrane sensor domain MASE1
MRAQIAAIAAAITALLGLKKALEALALIPLINEGMYVAAQGGNINPYITAMIGVVVAIMLPLGLLNAVADI